MTANLLAILSVWVSYHKSITDAPYMAYCVDCWPLTAPEVGGLTKASHSSGSGGSSGAGDPPAKRREMGSRSVALVCDEGRGFGEGSGSSDSMSSSDSDGGSSGNA